MDIALLDGINSENIFYFSYPRPGIIYSVVDGEVVIEHENIKNFKKYQLVIADLSSEDWGRGTIEMVYNLLQEYGISFIVLSQTPADHLTLPNLFFYPHWHDKTRYYHLNKFFPKFIQHDCRYKLSCLNRSPKAHRIYNWLLLRKKPYVQDIVMSMNNDFGIPNGGLRPDDPVLSANIVEEWNSVKGSLVDNFKRITPDERISTNFDTNHPAYNDSYINLVTESTVLPELFITEKTWKPVATGQLFLVHGTLHTMKYLRDCGVDVFDDIIDHSYYDSEPDWQIRADKIHQLIDHLVTLDLSKIYQETTERRLANHTKFLNGDFGEPYRSLVRQRITS